MLFNLFNRPDPRRPWENAPLWAIELHNRLGIIIYRQEKIMIDVAALQAAAARLQASDTKELALLQTIKDQNVSLAAQLAAIQTTDQPTQDAINAVVKQLTDTADAVDAAVAANPQTPNLAASPPA